MITLGERARSHKEGMLNHTLTSSTVMYFRWLRLRPTCEGNGGKQGSFLTAGEICERK